MTEPYAPDHLWQVIEAQADDMFALYQLAQVVAEATDLDELASLALPQIMRVSDSPAAALFLQKEPHGLLALVTALGLDEHEPGDSVERGFADRETAVGWFQTRCGLDGAACVEMELDVGRELPGILALTAPSRDGFSRHERHLLSTMAREVARVLRLALARADVERRHRQVEQMQSDFVAAVSHELRTPLALARASVDSLTHLKLTPEQQRRFIDDIGRSTAQLRRIVDTILDFSRIEDGAWSVSLQATRIADIAQRAVRELSDHACERVEVDVQPIDLHVTADPDKLAQVLTNLTSNALKYSAAASPIRIRARPWSPRRIAWLEVRDWGRGIPTDDQPYLFTRFFRARNVRESSSPGTGLGLYICKRLVEAQGGSIRLRSRPDHGTAVRVCLPMPD